MILQIYCINKMEWIMKVDHSEILHYKIQLDINDTTLLCILIFYYRLLVKFISHRTHETPQLSQYNSN